MSYDLVGIERTLPRQMPDGQWFEVGQPVIVRLEKRSSLWRGRVLRIFRGEEDYKSKNVGRGPEGETTLIKVRTDVGDELILRPFRDHIFTYKWVNEWAGKTLVEAPPSSPAQGERRQSARFRALFSRSREENKGSDGDS